MVASLTYMMRKKGVGLHLATTHNTLFLIMSSLIIAKYGIKLQPEMYITPPPPNVKPSKTHAYITQQGIPMREEKGSHGGCYLVRI